LATPTNELSYYISKRVLNQFVNAYSKIGVWIRHIYLTPNIHRWFHPIWVSPLEEIVSKSTLLATRPSRLAPKKCINKSIWLAPGRYPWCTHGRCLPGCQPNWFVYAFFGCESRWPSRKEGWFGHDFF
jgi:hypothetical protein